MLRAITEKMDKNLTNLRGVYRKVFWALGTLYNQYLEKNKAIQCFVAGLRLSDEDEAFEQSLRKLQNEDFFLIYYVYFKYKTAKLLRLRGRLNESACFAEEAKKNISEVAKRLESEGSGNIFAMEFLSIIRFIEKKVEKVLEDVGKKREGEAMKPRENLGKTDESVKKFEEYLLALKERRLKRSTTKDKEYIENVKDSNENKSKFYKKSTLDELPNKNKENEEILRRRSELVSKSKEIAPKQESITIRVKNLDEDLGKKLNKKTKDRNKIKEEASGKSESNISAQATNKTEANRNDQNSDRILKEDLLKRLRQSKEESYHQNEYLLKNVYKSNTAESIKLNQNFLKSLSMNKSKEIEKVYNSSQNLGKTSRTNTHRTASNFLIQKTDLTEKNVSKSRIYEILQRPDFETSRKSREISQYIKAKRREANSGNSETDDQNVRHLLHKIVNIAGDQQKGGYLAKPSLVPIEEKSSGFLTEKQFESSERIPTTPHNQYFTKKPAKNPNNSQFLKKRLQKKEPKTMSSDAIIIKIMKSEEIELRLPKETREGLKAEIINGLEQKSLLKKNDSQENIDINEEYRKIMFNEPSIIQNQSRISLKKSDALPHNFLRQPSRDEALSASSSIKKPHQYSILQKDSASEEEHKSIISAFPVPSMFLTSLKYQVTNFEAEEPMVSQEQRSKQIKAKNFILSRFRKYKKRKNFESSVKESTAMVTSTYEASSNMENPSLTTLVPSSNKYAKSALIKKAEAPIKKTYSSVMTDEIQFVFGRKVCIISKGPDIEIDLPLLRNPSLPYPNSLPNQNQVDLNPNKVQIQSEPAKPVKGINRYLRSFAQQIKEQKALQRLENISRPSFFFLKFIQGKLFKFKVKIRKFLVKDLLLNLVSQQGYCLELRVPLREERKSGVFMEYKTVWPVVFEALLAALKEKKFLREEEFFSELEGFEKPLSTMKLGFLENPSFFKNNKMTHVDIENIGHIKMLFDVIFEKSVEFQNKPTGKIIKDVYFSAKSFSTKNFLVKRLRQKIVTMEKVKRTKQCKDSRKMGSFMEDLSINELKCEIGNLDEIHRDDLWRECCQFLNKNNLLTIFITRDLYWRKFWLIKVSWTWESPNIGPFIKVSGLDWRHFKQERTFKFFDWERFKRKSNKKLDYKLLMKEYLLFSGLRKRSRKILLAEFSRAFTINNNCLIILSEEEKKKHKSIREFFQKNEVFGGELTNMNVKTAAPARNDPLFRKGFDSIYSQFFEDKREFIEEDKENKNIKTEDFEDIGNTGTVERLMPNKISIDEHEEKSRRHSLGFFRVEKANTFYAYLKNFIKYHKLSKLYFRLRKKMQLINLRVIFDFDDETDSVRIRMSFYEIFRRSHSFCEIKDLKDIILTTNILLVSNPKVKHSQIHQNTQEILQFNGRKFSGNSQTLDLRKLTLNEYSLKAFVMNNFIEKINGFERKDVVFLQDLEGIGKCSVFLTIYYPKTRFYAEYRTLFSITLLSLISKTKKFKLIFTLDDLSTAFSNVSKMLGQEEEIDFHTCKLIFMKIMKHFSLETSSLYSNLVCSSKKSDKSGAVGYRFERIRRIKNCFNEKRGIPIFPKRNSGFLEEFVQESRVVLRLVKKYQGNFYCVVISKSLLMNYWIMRVYIPKTSRSFIAYLNSNDLLKLPLTVLSAAFPWIIQERISNPESFMNFNDFLNNKGSKCAESGKGNRQREEFSRSLPFQGQNSGENLKRLREKVRKAYMMTKFTSNRIRKMQRVKAIIDLTKKLDNFTGSLVQKTQLTYCEISIWLRLLEKMQIIIDKTQKFEIAHEDFSVLLKEVLFWRYVKVDNTNEAYIEIFLTFLSDNPSVFHTVDSINYAYSLNFNFIIKYLSLNRMNIQIDSINLRELINIYISDGFYKHPTNYMHSKLLMSDVKDLCHFLTYKIKSSNFCNFLHNANETNLKKRRKMHANDNISYMRKIEKESKFVGQIYQINTLIARAKPYCLIGSSVSESERKVIFNVYNSRHSDIFLKEISFSQMRNKGLFFENLINNREWKSLIERLWKIVEKEVLIEAEFNFKFNEKA